MALLLSWCLLAGSVVSLTQRADDVQHCNELAITSMQENHQKHVCLLKMQQICYNYAAAVKEVAGKVARQRASCEAKTTEPETLLR